MNKNKGNTPPPPAFSYKKQAFTLIELLVVVLIIGILSAVALPQYTKAVEKSKSAEGLTNLKAVVQASEIYNMENQSYPALGDWDSITISFPGEREYYASVDADVWKSGEWRYYLGYAGGEVWARYGSEARGYYFRYSPADKKYYCSVYNASQKFELHKQLCAVYCKNNPQYAEHSDRLTCIIP